MTMPRLVIGSELEGRETLSIDIHGVHHVSDVVQYKVPLFIGGESHPLVPGKKILENNALVPLIVYC